MQNVIFNTCGDGHWSSVAKAVRIVDMKIGYCADDKDFAELCVFFDTATWDNDADGLIYTDAQFLQELNAFLVAHGLATAEYSEQGMQGEDYVSLDVEGDFIAKWEAKFGEVETF